MCHLSFTSCFALCVSGILTTLLHSFFFMAAAFVVLSFLSCPDLERHHQKYSPLFSCFSFHTSPPSFPNAFNNVTPFLPQCIQQFQSLHPLKLCILILCTPTFPPSLPPFLPPFLSAAAAAQAISYSGEVTGAWSGPLQSSDLWRLSCTRTHVHTKPTRERMAHLVGKGGREEETKRGDK